MKFSLGGFSLFNVSFNYNDKDKLFPLVREVRINYIRFFDNHVAPFLTIKNDKDEVCCFDLNCVYNLRISLSDPGSKTHFKRVYINCQ